MNFLHKKLWLAWSKFRFLRMPVERRVRLEVTTDGRHLTFLLVSLYEAGYGVQVYGGNWFFRELMLLRKTAPIPFMYGGKETECGISITDQPSTLDAGRSSLFVLDYDYFSGLMERVEPRISRIYTDGQQGDAQETCAGDAFSNPSTSELARDSENTPSTRSANGSAGTLRADHMGLGSDGGNQPADSVEFLNGQSQAGLQMDKQKDHTIRPANDPNASGENSSFDSRLPLGASPCGPTSGCSSSRLTEQSVVPIRDIRGKNSSSLDTGHSPLVIAPQALRMPYFMHPSVYHRGLHKRRSPDNTLDARRSTLDSAAKQRRRFRLGFFGTHDREFYTNHYHFPGMNRFEILEVFLQKFGNRMRPLRGFPRDWDSCEMAVSIDDRGGDRKGKSFLSQEHYFKALWECDFVLSPPGWCMPVSHNLIEAMFCGAIPITNGGAFMAGPLTDGLNCLEFEDAVGLVSVIERALAMDSGEVSRMQQAGWDYYDRFLGPAAFAQRMLQLNDKQILVNAEEKSVQLVFPEKNYTKNNPASLKNQISKL